VIGNQGNLPTYLTHQGRDAGLAKTVRARISLTGAKRIGGEETVDLGHLEGLASPDNLRVRRVTWVVKAEGESPSAVVQAVSEKGGRHARRITLDR